MSAELSALSGAVVQFAVVIATARIVIHHLPDKPFGVLFVIAAGLMDVRRVTGWWLIRWPDSDWVGSFDNAIVPHAISLLLLFGVLSLDSHLARGGNADR